MLAAYLFLLLALLPTPGRSCSNLIVGKDATSDGSVLLAGSSDGGGTGDPRLIWIQSRDFPEGAARPVYPNTEIYPRFIGPGRGGRNCATHLHKNVPPGRVHGRVRVS